MRVQYLNQFYELLSKLEVGLGEKYHLQRHAGKIPWANRGVYFFFEPGEFRSVDKSLLRVVRVGTHAVSIGSKTTLWKRLSQHRGSVFGGGNNRGSVFRRHVGAALINKTKRETLFPEWGVGGTASRDTRAKEKPLEIEVSEFIGQMTVLFLAIDDEPSSYCDRAYIEQNSIALLSGCHGFIDPPSQQWLGNYVPHQAIRSSGLWNVNYVWREVDPHFLDVMSFYVDVTLGIRPKPNNSISPTDWH